MITGLNSSVKFEEQEFHVQTEDRGRENPVLESLIYQGGAIVGSKKTSYKDLLESGTFDEHHLRKMLEAQHYSIVQAIRSGRVSVRGKAQRAEQVSPAPMPPEIQPHAEVSSSASPEESPDLAREVRVRLVETSSGLPLVGVEVPVEVFGVGTSSQKLKGKTNDEGYLEMKLDLPADYRVAAAMLFRVDQPQPSHELMVLVVKSSQN